MSNQVACRTVHLPVASSHAVLGKEPFPEVVQETLPDGVV